MIWFSVCNQEMLELHEENFFHNNFIPILGPNKAECIIRFKPIRTEFPRYSSEEPFVNLIISMAYIT